ncbi:MAG: hypothetical protein GXO47_07025 [Chlorobi bacterium]|nr:hypothetical protein [Chlorobiota bacterium]
MVLDIVLAIGEIRMHKSVKSINFPKINELLITFKDTYADLVIPLTPDMDNGLITGIFYEYINSASSRLQIA